MPSWYERYDILVNGFLPVEVKASRAYKQWTGKLWRYRWQFDLSGGLSANKEDFIYCLVAVDGDGELFPFIIPSAWTVGRSKTPSLTSHPSKYRGWMSSGLNAWQWIDTVYSWRLKYKLSSNGQMTLPLPDLNLLDNNWSEPTLKRPNRFQTVSRTEAGSS